MQSFEKKKTLELGIARPDMQALTEEESTLAELYQMVKGLSFFDVQQAIAVDDRFLPRCVLDDRHRVGLWRSWQQFKLLKLQNHAAWSQVQSISGVSLAQELQQRLGAATALPTLALRLPPRLAHLVVHGAWARIAWFPTFLAQVRILAASLHDAPAWHPRS